MAIRTVLELGDTVKGDAELVFIAELCGVVEEFDVLDGVISVPIRKK